MKKASIIFVGIIVAFLLGEKIYAVNKVVCLPTVKEWQIGEWVPMEDNYFLEEYEICNGYEIRVNEAELLTCDEFLEKYFCDQEEIMQDGKLLPDMVYDVSVTVRNVNQEDADCGLDLSNNDLFATDFTLRVHPDLYALANAEKKNTTTMFSLQPESELDFQIPYGIATTAEHAYLTPDVLEERDLYLLISLYPVQNQVLIHKE